MSLDLYSLEQGSGSWEFFLLKILVHSRLCSVGFYSYIRKCSRTSVLDCLFDEKVTWSHFGILLDSLVFSPSTEIFLFFFLFQTAIFFAIYHSVFG